MRQAREPRKAVSISVLLDPSGSRVLEDEGVNRTGVLQHVLDMCPGKGSHCCLAERKPRQSQKYLNTTKNAPKCQADVGTQVKWSILRFRTKAEHPSAPSGPTPWLSVAQWDSHRKDVAQWKQELGFLKPQVSALITGSSCFVTEIKRKTGWQRNLALSGELGKATSGTPAMD